MPGFEGQNNTKTFSRLAFSCPIILQGMEDKINHLWLESIGFRSGKDDGLHSVYQYRDKRIFIRIHRQTLEGFAAVKNDYFTLKTRQDVHDFLAVQNRIESPKNEIDYQYRYKLTERVMELLRPIQVIDREMITHLRTDEVEELGHEIKQLYLYIQDFREKRIGIADEFKKRLEKDWGSKTKPRF